LGNDIKLAASDFRNALAFYQKKMRNQKDNLAWLNQQHKFFESQVASCLQAADNIIKQLRLLISEFNKNIKSMDAHLVDITKIEVIAKKN